MNYTDLLKLWPYAAILILGMVVWGGYGYLKEARHAAQEAQQRADGLQTKLDEADKKRRSDEAVLAQNEKDRIALQQRLAVQQRKIAEFHHEECVRLDDPAPWLDQLLPVRTPVPTDGG